MKVKYKKLKKREVDCDSWHKICFLCFPFHASCHWKVFRVLYKEKARVEEVIEE